MMTINYCFKMFSVSVMQSSFGFSDIKVIAVPTGSSIKWDHFEVLAKGRSYTHCKIKETLLIKDLEPT